MWNFGEIYSTHVIDLNIARDLALLYTCTAVHIVRVSINRIILTQDGKRKAVPVDTVTMADV